MENWYPSSPAIAIFLFFAGVVAITLVKLIWGMSQWAKKPQHRVGQRWGGEHVEVVEWSGRSGYVRAGGELWSAVSKDELAPGDSVKVAKMDGLVLEVRKVS
jgi:membrane protein implicated in regulation of membrane protease activity